MRNTELKTCDLSSNVIKKIPPKFALKFSLITGKRSFNGQCATCYELIGVFFIECNYAKKNALLIHAKHSTLKTHISLFIVLSITDLNLSNNQINKLPDELADLACLLRLDISHNLFLTLPTAVFKMPKLRQLKANNNAIIGESIMFFFL